MGYTHYCKKEKGYEGSEGYEEALPIIKEILKRHADIIQFEYNNDERPICNDDLIRFNGIEDEGNETFLFLNEMEEFSFCKTARKPYDVVVCECLIVLNHFMPYLIVGSDGMYGCVKDEEKGFTIDSKVLNPDGMWDEAMSNVSTFYSIYYEPICSNIRGLYYDWVLEEMATFTTG